MLKHFIIVIYTVVIMTTALACAEPYGTEIPEDTNEENSVEFSEGPSNEIIEDPSNEIPDDTNEENSVEFSEDPSNEIIEDPLENIEDPSNEIIVEDIDEHQVFVDKLNAIINDFTQNYLNEYPSNSHIADMPNFCKIVSTSSIYYYEAAAISCTLPDEIKAELDNTFGLDSEYIKYSDEYCDEAWNCESHSTVEYIAVTALMQKLNLLSTNCDVEDNATVYCGYDYNYHRVFCAHSMLAPKALSEQWTQSIDDIELTCHPSGRYDHLAPTVTYTFYIASYNEIGIAEASRQL